MHSEWGGRIITNSHSYVLLGVEGTTPMPLQMIINGTIEFIGYVSLYKGVKCVVTNDAYLRIGNGTYINEYTRIFTYHKICIGAGCAISWNVVITDTDIHKIFNKEIHVNPNRSVDIGDNVWIGANCAILPGVTIGDNVTIGAGSVVNRDIPSNTVAVGNPCRVIKNI